MKHPSPLTRVLLFAFVVLVSTSLGDAGAADVIKFGIATPLSEPAAP